MGRDILTESGRTTRRLSRLRNDSMYAAETIQSGPSDLDVLRKNGPLVRLPKPTLTDYFGPPIEVRSVLWNLVKVEFRMLFGFFASDKPGRMGRGLEADLLCGPRCRMCVVLIFGGIQGVCLGDFVSADGRIRQAPICDIFLPNSVSRCNPPCWDAQREDLGLGR